MNAPNEINCGKCGLLQLKINVICVKPGCGNSLKKIDYHVEIVNVSIKKHKTVIDQICRYAYTIPVFLIPGLEVPFRGLNLDHNYDESFKETRS